MTMPRGAQKRFVIIDANALIHRSYHALPVLTDRAGNPTHAIYGFTSVLIRLFDELKPDYLVAAFDLDKPTFRHEKYAAYKGTRSKTPDDLIEQIPKIKGVLRAFGVPVLELAGFEADDIIGTVSRQMGGRKVGDRGADRGKASIIETIIVTGDLDTLQLIDSHTKVYTLKKGITDTVMYNEAAVRERFGLRPDQLADYKGLVGDSSDNIPGVAGVGPKGASELLTRFETLEGVFQVLEKDDNSIKPALANKLREHKDTALFSKELATIECAVPITVSLKDAAWKEFDKDAVKKELLQYGFRSLLERLGIGQIVTAVSPSAMVRYATYAGAEALAKLLEKQPIITFGYSDATGAVNAEARAASASNFLIGWDARHIYRVPVSDVAKFRDIFEDEDIVKQAFESKAFMKLLQREGIALRGFDFHGFLAAWLIKPGLKTYDLKKYAAGIEGGGEGTEQERVGTDDELLCMVARLMTARPKLERELQKLELTRVHDTIEMPLVEVLAAMELHGMKVDPALLKELSDELGGYVDTLEKQVYQEAGVEFNIRSPKQLREILFDRMKLPLKGIRKTPGGDISTNEQELTKLAKTHPIINHMLEYRELFKLKSTYTDALPAHLDADNRIHTTLNQTGAVTGRLSSSDPNLQNIPIRSEWGKRIRAAFVAPRGYKLVGFDYAQAELHVVAHLSQDETLLEAFRNHEDIHAITASEVYGVAIKDVTPEMRRVAKVFNFGVIYGLSASGITQRTGLTRDEGQAFIDAYFAKFPKIKQYIDDTIAFAQKHGYVKTLLGRRRYLPGIKTGAYQARAAAEREAINMPVQGTVGDIMKLAMVKIYNELVRPDKQGDCYLIMQIHDELLFEIRTDKVEHYKTRIAQIMEQIYALDAPLRVDAHVGDNWGELK